MRALAELIMSGRWQAVVIAFIGLPVISPAAVALVTLRRGALDGAWVLAALVFPALLLLFMGFGMVAVLLSNLLSSVLIFGAALLLRSNRSWPLTLVFVAVVSTIGAYFIVWSVDLRADMLKMAESMKMGDVAMVDFKKAVDELLALHLAAPITILSVAMGVVFSLLVARYWQAQLFNPGGFREEFHSLRLDIRLVAIAGIVGLGLMQLPNVRGGILIVVLPLFFAGLGYIHWLAAQKRLAWVLWVLYMSMFLSLWISATVVTIGLLDSVFNLRKRINEDGV